MTGDWTQVEIIHLPNEPSVGLGFGIVGGASTGVVIKTILPGSAADKASFLALKIKLVSGHTITRRRPNSANREN